MVMSCSTYTIVNFRCRTGPIESDRACDRHFLVLANPLRTHGIVVDGRANLRKG